MLVALLCAGFTSAWGEEVTLVSGSGNSNYAVPENWTSSGTVEGGTYLKFDNGTITSPVFAPHNGLSFSYSVATFGSGTNHPLTIRILNASTNAVLVEKTTATPTSSSYITTDSPISLGDVNVSFKIQLYGPTGKGVRLRNYSVIGTPAGGSSTTTCAAPTFTPAEGTYPVAQNVTLGSTTDDAIIYYTTDGNDPTENSDVYSSPIVVSTTQTIKAMAVKNGLDNSPVVSAEYKIQPNKPTITINEGVVSISADANMTIYYTTDGNDPLKTSNLYSEPFSPSHSCTIKAIAVDANDNLSEIASAYYVYQKNINSDYYVKVTDASTLEEGDVIIIVNDNKSYERVLGADRGNNRAAPAIANKPSGGIIDGPGEDAQRITLVPIEENWYLYTGEEGYLYAASSSSNNLKTGQISVAGDNAKAAISIREGNATIQFQGSNSRNLIRYNSSSELFSCYASGQNDVQIYKKVVKPVVVVATPTFSVEEGTYFEAQNVTISCATTGATIRYTTDGSEPTATTGTVYSEPLNISTTTTLKAIAVKGEDVSAVATATYTFPTVYSLSQMNAQTDAKDYYVKFDNAVVTYVNGKYVFIEDATGAILFFNTNTYTEKQVLNGTAKVTWKLFNGQPEATAIAAIDGVTFTTDGSVESVSPAVVTLADLSGNNKDSYISKFVTLNGVTVNEGNLVQGESSLAYYCRNGVALTEGSKYNLTGFLGIYEKDNVKTYQLYLYTTDHVVEYPAAPTFSIEGGTFNEAQTIELSCVTEGATIQYSIDNANWVTYSDPIVINETTTITAKAVKDGLESEEVSASYTLRQPGTIRLYFAHDPETNLTAHTMSCGAAVNLNYETNSNGTISIQDMTDGITVIPNTDNKTVTLLASTNNGKVFSQPGEYTFRVVVGETDSYTSASVDFKLKVVKFRAYFNNLTGFEETKDLANGTNGGQLKDQLFSNTQWGDASYKTWTSTNEDVATIDNDGNITLISTGQVRFIHSYTGNDYNEPCKISTGVMTVIDSTPVVEPSVPAPITAGYYRIKNVGNGKYVNVAGRKTVTFVDNDATATAAGTVLKVESNDKGQVQVLRSQAIDLPGYADKAMKYVPEVVQLVVNKLHAEGSGAILGENGLDKIMEKFDASFDYHLYTEQAEGGIRIYGKTPSMRPVVEFYNENKDNVDAKLPMLEDFINDAINKILDKTGGRGSSILVPFSLHDVWKNMGSSLTEPKNDATKLTFLQEVLSNEQNVWDFAYQTAMIYWGKVKEHPRYDEFKGKLGDYAKYIDKIEYIRPNVKYYLATDGTNLDVLSQDNELVKTGTAALWALEERDDFQATFDEKNVLNGKYYTTLYTDFAYTLPEGVKAYKVTKVSDAGVAVKVALESVPAQTPVLLESESAGAKTLTLNTDEGTAPTDNILVGADAIINEYDINESQVVSLFEFALEVLGESTYNEYLAKYEHLMDRNSGTVNNKFFFGLTTKELGEGADEEGLISARSLAMQDNLLGFYENWDVSANHAFLLNKDYDPVKLFLKGDIDRDGDVDNNDLKALIKIILGTDTEEDNYDYDAAHVNDDEDIDIADVTALVNYLKNLQTQTNN